MQNRPFFSIIVPCYNSDQERIGQLMESLYRAGCNEETEIIIVDDRSTKKDYLAIVDSYSKNSTVMPDNQQQLNVIVTTVPDLDENGVELIHCPGNTREQGVRQATGQWITFVDHDDLLTDKILEKVKQKIIEEDEKELIFTNFLELNPYDNTVKNVMEHSVNWCHGKFYNLDNFWNKYDFHFKTNIFSNEDIAINSKTHCLVYKLKRLNVLWLDEIGYIWRCYSDSTSHNDDLNGVNYMEKYFLDYLSATNDTYVEYYKQNMDSMDQDEKDYQKELQVDSILFQYLYLQSFKFNHINQYSFEYEMMIKQNIRAFYERFNMNPISLYNYVANKDKILGSYYDEVRSTTVRSVGPFIEVDSFYDFISK